MRSSARKGAMDELEDSIVFLCRYGRMSPEWLEEQDLGRFTGLVEKVGNWISRENGKRETNPTQDSAQDYE